MTLIWIQQLDLKMKEKLLKYKNVQLIVLKKMKDLYQQKYMYRICKQKHML